MKKLNILRIVVLLALIVWVLKDKDYKILHLSNFSLSNMAGDIFYPVLFILLGLFTLFYAILVRRDGDFAKKIATSTSEGTLWSKILGVERAVRLYQSLAPSSIVISVGVIIFGIVLFFI